MATDPNAMSDQELDTAIQQQSTTATGEPAEPQEPEMIEVRTATGQVYRGKTKDEVIEQFKKAQENATIHIKEQHDKLKEFEAKLAAQTAPPPTTGGFDKAQYFKLLEENPLSAQDYLDSFRPQYERVMSAVEKFEYGLHAQEFMRRVKDYEDSPENAELLFTRLKAEGRAPTADNMQIVYSTLQSEGLLKKAAQEPVKPATPTPPPAIGGASVQTSELAGLDSEIAGMNDAQFEEYLRKRGIQIV